MNTDSTFSASSPLSAQTMNAVGMFEIFVVGTVSYSSALTFPRCIRHIFHLLMSGPNFLVHRLAKCGSKGSARKGQQRIVPAVNIREHTGFPLASWFKPGPLSFNAHGGILSLISENTPLRTITIFTTSPYTFHSGSGALVPVDHGDAEVTWTPPLRLSTVAAQRLEFQSKVGTSYLNTVGCRR